MDDAAVDGAPMDARVKVARQHRAVTVMSVLVALVMIAILVGIAGLALSVFFDDDMSASKAELRSDTLSIAEGYDAWALDGHQGETYPDVTIDARATTSSNALEDLAPDLSGNTQIHAFDVGAYYPDGGFKPGRAYCIEIRHLQVPGDPTYYHSAKGGFISTTCESP
jgi:hypothetical protein